MANQGSNQGREFADGYIAMLPSMRGFGAALSRELSRLGSNPALFSGFTRAMSRAMADAARNGLGGGVRGTFRSSPSMVAPLTAALRRSGAAIAAPLAASIRASGRLLTTTLKDSARLGLAGVGTAIAGVTGTIAGAGFNRAVNLNDSIAKLKALGNTGSRLESIMENASAAVDGTSYSLSESVATASQLLAAGIKPGEELVSILNQTTKLADISGRSFGDMGTIMSKNAASGIVQQEDLNQLIDAGVPIYAYLQKQMGLTVKQIKKMATEGKISFRDFSNAIGEIQFDSVLYATESITKNLTNTRSRLGRIGEKFWTPLFDGLNPVIVRINNMLTVFLKNFDFGPAQRGITRFTSHIAQAVDDFKLDEFIDKLEDIQNGGNLFANNLKKIQGPIVGLMAGIAGSALSNLPVVGGLFAGLTPLVGLFGGTLFQAYRESDRLQESVGALWSNFKNLAKSIVSMTLGGAAGDSFQQVGDRIAEVTEFINRQIVDLTKFFYKPETAAAFKSFFSSLYEGIANFVNEVKARWPEIKAAVGGIFAAIGAAFSGSGTGGLDGATLASTLVDVFLMLARALTVAIPIIASVASTVASIVASDVFAQVFSWLAGLAKLVIENETLFTIMISLLAGWFIGRKLVGPITSMLSFMGVFSKGSSTPGGGAGAAGLLRTIAVFSAVLLAFVALGAALSMVDAPGMLKELGETFKVFMGAFDYIAANPAKIVAAIAGFIVLNKFSDQVTKSLKSFSKALPKMLGYAALIVVTIGAFLQVLNLVGSVLKGTDAVENIAYFFSLLSGAFDAVAANPGKIVAAIAGFLILGKFSKPITSAVKSFASALPKLLVYAVIIAVAIGAFLEVLNGLGYILKETNAVENIKYFGEALMVVWEWIVDALGYVLEKFYSILIGVGERILGIITEYWPKIEPIITFFRDSLLLVFLTISNQVIKAADTMAEHIPTIIDSLAGLTTEVFSGLSGLLTTLAEDGLAAGVGGVAAAGGIAAIMTAMAAGGVAGGIGNTLGQFTSLPGDVLAWGKDKAGVKKMEESNPLTQLTAMLEVLRSAGDIITSFPSNWSGTLIGAYNFGASMTLGVSRGMTSMAPTLHENFRTQIEAMMASAQEFLDQNPLEVRTNTDGLDFGAAGGGSVTNNTRNVNTSITNSDRYNALTKGIRGTR